MHRQALALALLAASSTEAFVAPTCLQWHPLPLWQNQQRHNKAPLPQVIQSMVSTESDTSDTSGSSTEEIFTTTLPDTSTPLHPHTFAGMVEQGLKEKFGGPQQIQRILTSWRLLDQDYEHKEYVGPDNVSPGDSMCHQHCHSYVPGLASQEFWDPDQTTTLNKWALPLQKKYQDIKEEFTRVALADSEKLAQEGNNIWASALTEDASSYGVDWKTLVLCDRGVWDPVSLRKQPSIIATPRLGFERIDTDSMFPIFCILGQCTPVPENSQSHS